MEVQKFLSFLFERDMNMPLFFNILSLDFLFFSNNQFTVKNFEVSYLMAYEKKE
jgi:hypothetical protein